MNRRLVLHQILCDILGSENVYFQPPSTIRMQYPAIVYDVDVLYNQHADNSVYLSTKKYSITVIEHCPESDIVDKIAHLPTCRFDRSYTKDNLYYSVFTIVF